MKKIEAKIVADSINPQGNRITTMLLTYPRFIHGELLTHRVFSKNSASSRAIPFKKMVEMVETDPFTPVAWQKNHKGMQGTEYFTEDSMISNTNKPVKISKKRSLHYSAANKFKPLLTAWHLAKKEAIEKASALHNAGVTKQLCNRLLEPFMWHTVLLTGTEFENFFELRCPQYEFDDRTFKSIKDVCNYIGNCELVKMDEPTAILTSHNTTYQTTNISQAEIHIQALAEAMWDAMNENTPKELKAGEWHIPFEDNIDDMSMALITDSIRNVFQVQEGYARKYENTSKELDEVKIKIATARCARLSYMTFDGEIDYEKDIKLHDTLLESQHYSPFEHCARAMGRDYDTFIKGELTLEKVTQNSQHYKMDRDDRRNIGWCNNYKGFIQYRYLIENKT